ncbi:hypothetical protein B0H14DRAFT_3885993 [Mycena olivaceomarginata]|nr:hypothetical protein B0H14DRAFT_3885993 [Mycena olivaceomarginata]
MGPAIGLALTGIYLPIRIPPGLQSSHKVTRANPCDLDLCCRSVSVTHRAPPAATPTENYPTLQRTSRTLLCLCSLSRPLRSLSRLAAPITPAHALRQDISGLQDVVLLPMRCALPRVAPQAPRPHLPPAPLALTPHPLPGPTAQCVPARVPAHFWAGSLGSTPNAAHAPAAHRCCAGPVRPALPSPYLA